MSKNPFELTLDKYVNHEKIGLLKLKLFKTVNNGLDDLLKHDFLYYLESLKEKESPNCVECKHWNYGRMYWICNKDHSILYDSKDRLIRADKIGRFIIPFLETTAKTGCKDWKRDDQKREFNHLKLEYKEIDYEENKISPD
jgi:hypothetical protein